MACFSADLSGPFGISGILRKNPSVYGGFPQRKSPDFLGTVERKSKPEA